MNIYLIIWLLFAHWIADFVAQSDYVAKNKSKSNKVLLAHCMLYGIVLGTASINAVFGLLVGLVHFPVDYVTSRLNAKLYAKGDIHNFFVSIGFDQWVHMATIILLAEKLL